MLTIACPVACLYGLRHRHDERIERALPQMLETAAAALRSGASLLGALAAAAQLPGPLRPDIETIVAAVNRGAPLGAELDRWAVRRPLPSIRLTAAALVMGVEAGGARARAVDGIADTLRDRAAIQREVAAQSAQARSSMVVMSAVPVVVALLAASTDDRTAEFLFSTAAGALCLLSGLALDGLAILWMVHLIRRASHMPAMAR